MCKGTPLKTNQNFMANNLDDLLVQWEEMTPSELRRLLTNLEKDEETISSALNEKRAILKALREFIANLYSDNMYDEYQND